MFTVLVLLLAQAASATGTWALKSEAVKSENQSMSAIEGTLTLEQTGQSVKGTWRGPRETWQLSGQIKGGQFEMESEEKNVGVMRNGVKGETPAQWMFRGSIVGDTMTGRMWLTTKSRDSLAQPFKAQRSKGR
jgi:hypothetical protein